MLQALSGLPMVLARPVPLLVTLLKLKFLGKTARERREIIDAGNGELLVL